MIFQHQTADVCPYKGTDYACTGCEGSGKTRQRIQGKKYSSSAYSRSVKASLQYLRDNLRTYPKTLFIHNSGDPDRKSIVVRLGDGEPEFTDAFKEKMTLYRSSTFQQRIQRVKTIIRPSVDTSAQKLVPQGSNSETLQSVRKNLNVIQRRQKEQTEQQTIVTGALIMFNMAVIGFSIMSAAR